MQNQEISQKIKNILVNYVDTDKRDMQRETYLIDDLGLCSMDVITMVADLEEEFDIQIEEEDLHSFVQVKDLEEYICKKMENE